MKKTILLFRPNPSNESVGFQSFMICEPLEFEYVASYLEPLGHTVTIIDMMLEKRSIKSFVQEYKPDIVGFTSYITQVNVVKQYAKEVKELDSSITTVVGGVQAEVCPQHFEDENIDLIFYMNGL